MKSVITTRKLFAALALVSLSSGHAAWAASAFSSYATITYTINSITNLSNPGDLSGLEILGYFEQPGAPDSYVSTTGNGTVTADNPAIGPVSVGNSFTRTFAINGNVSDGTVDSSHLGWFGLEFNNTGGDSYSVELVLDYELSASVSGQYGRTEIFLDYFNTDYSVSGADFVSASIFGMPNATKSETSGSFVFNLGPNASEGLYADVRINGNLEASPVPLPGAVWFFLTGLLTFTGLRKQGTWT